MMKRIVFPFQFLIGRLSTQSNLPNMPKKQVCFNSLQVDYQLSTSIGSGIVPLSFNSLQVDYQPKALLLDYCRYAQFQFLIGRLSTSISPTIYTIFSCGFNSLQVDYQRYPHLQASFPHCSFNSLQVDYQQYKPVAAKNLGALFQFLIGRLSTLIAQLLCLKDSLSFNSLQVDYQRINIIKALKSCFSFNSLQVDYQLSKWHISSFFALVVSIPYRQTINPSATGTYIDSRNLCFNSLQVDYQPSPRSLYPCTISGCFNSLQVDYQLRLQKVHDLVGNFVSIPYRQTINPYHCSLYILYHILFQFLIGRLSTRYGR